MGIGTVTASLVIISVMTSLATEGVKKILNDIGKNYSSNILAGIVAVFISAAYGAGYIVFFDLEITAILITYLICIVFLSWLCAMVGYDKVKQAIEQITSGD